jgi:cytochrome c oxidase cbb3-type subunit I
VVIVLAAITLPLGITSGKEYAELEWPIDILIARVWVAYALVFVGTIARRKVSHIYVANWFFGAFILTVALLHIVNSAAMPVGFWKSYSAYAGVQDAMIQWWYGHNAVGFFLTAGFLGMMYYFIPKQAGRPIYSYRLSIVHLRAGRSTRTGSPSCTSGRSSSRTCGRARTTCTSPHCRIGPSPSA